MRARVVIILVLALLLASCGDDEGGVFSTGTTGVVTTSGGSETTAGQETTTTGAATTSTQATTTTGPAGMAWARVPDTAAFDPPDGATSVAMMSVVVGGPGLVAVGYEASDDYQVGAVWTSPDGLTWSRVPHDDAAFGPASGPTALRINSVTAGGPGLVAVGTEFSDAAGLDAAVWTSPDGVRWSRVPDDDAIFGGYHNQAMESVVAGGPRLVAVGWDISVTPGVAAVWTSADGLTWSRVPDVAPGTAEYTMKAVIVGGPGLVAVGSEWGGEDADAAAWTSVDGLTWTQAPHDEAVLGGPDSQSMEAVVVGGPGLVAVGFDYSGGDCDAAVWTSVDGLTWTRVPHDEALFGGPGEQSMGGAAPAGTGLVAVGYDYADEEGAVLVWWSADGVAWTRLPGDDAVFGGDGWASMEEVTVGGPGLVAVGEAGGTEVTGAAVWVSPPAG